MFSVRCELYLIAHETAICRNPSTHNVKGDRKKLDRCSTDQHVSMLCFYENIMLSNFFFLQNILTDVLVTQRFSTAGISV